MPYIDAHKRAKLDELIDELGARAADTDELGYALARLLHVFTYEHQKDYELSELNEIVAALETVKLEFFLENIKAKIDWQKEKNGDLFEHDAAQPRVVVGGNFISYDELAATGRTEGPGGPGEGPLRGTDGGGTR